MLIAAASSLSGNPLAAEAAAARAWAQSAEAPADAIAPTTIAVLRAGLAAVRGNTALQAAMLGAANAQSATPSGNLSELLPVCGDDGLRPSDWVMFAAATGPDSLQRVLPIAASRAAAVRPFVRHLAGNWLVHEGDEVAARGTVVTVSCRTTVHSNFVEPTSIADPVQDYFLRRGVYAPIVDDSPDSDVSELIRNASIELEESAARVGQHSMLLVPQWLSLAALLETGYLSGSNVNRGRITDLRALAVDALRADGANSLAEALAASFNVQRLTTEAARGNRDLAAIESAMIRVGQNLPFRVARAWTVSAFEGGPAEAKPIKARVLTELAKREPADFSKRERQAWLLQLADAQRDAEMDREAIRNRKLADLPPDQCASFDQSVALVHQPFTFQDFPSEQLDQALTGVTSLELEVTAAGTVKSSRVLISVPSGSFDKISIEKGSELRYEPVFRDGRPAGCRGRVQPVRWRLPPRGTGETPTFVPRRNSIAAET